MGTHHNKVDGRLFREVQNCSHRMCLNDFEFQIHFFRVDSEDFLDMFSKMISKAGFGRCQFLKQMIAFTSGKIARQFKCFCMQNIQGCVILPCGYCGILEGQIGQFAKIQRAKNASGLEQKMSAMISSGRLCWSG